MPTNIEVISEVLSARWASSRKAAVRAWVGAFYNRIRSGLTITADLDTEQGRRSLLIDCSGDLPQASCSCPEGMQGECPHCHALALSFLKDPRSFDTAQALRLEEAASLNELRKLVRQVKLAELLDRLKAKGISNKAFAESIKMNPGHLSAVKSAERAGYIYNELGAIKLACLWVLEHCASPE